MAKRGENIYRRRDGRWEGRYIKGRKKDGKPRYGYVYGHRYGVVKAKLLPFKHRYAGTRGTSGEYEGTFSDFAAAWMGELSRSSRKPSTLAFYDALLRTHLLPAFGKRPLRSVTREDVASFFESLLETNMGINSVRNVTGLLCRIMKAAVSGNTLACNPCDGMAQPKRETIPVSALRLREQRKLEGEAVRDRDGLAVLLALYTGMRIGEICALKWEDVDLAAGLVYVRRTLQRVRAENGPRKTETVFGSPKSVRSRRSIPLASSLIEFLKEAECERTGEYVISRGKGFAEPRAVRYRFGRILRKAGIPHMRFHVLRHTFATRCMETGANITTLSRLLGHASVKMTLDVYTDATPECKAAAVNGLDKLGLRRRAA